jgi:predicted  nucleic acid-binding Zn-ribbon protein
MKNIADVFEDMKVLIDSFQKNYEAATKKAVEIRDRIIRNEKDIPKKRQKCMEINIKLVSINTEYYS